MTVLNIPDSGFTTDSPEEIQDFLSNNGIEYQRWSTPESFDANASQDEILKAYEDHLSPLMEKNGYKTADVINVHAQTKGVDELRQKFLREHTHTEDEVRFFIEGSGLFWFHTNSKVFSVFCTEGDLINVPKDTKHWFDLGDNPNLKVIRIFTNPEGWVAQYTHSGIDSTYNPGLAVSP